MDRHHHDVRIRARARLGAAFASYPDRVLRELVTECFRVRLYPDVSCHNSNQRGRLAQQLGCGEMNGIEGSDRFEWECPPHPGEHSVRHRNQVTAPLESPKRPYRRPFLVDRQPPGPSCAKNRSRGFGDRQGGRDLASSSADRLERACVTLQERGDQSARLDVPNANRISARRWRLALRFATVVVDQFGGGSGGQANVGPPFGWVAGFERRPYHS
jgi:hypothetical protein